jgi:hypothetical protein
MLRGSDGTKIGLRLRLVSANVRPQGRSTPFSTYPCKEVSSPARPAPSRQQSSLAHTPQTRLLPSFHHCPLTFHRHSVTPDLRQASQTPVTAKTFPFATIEATKTRRPIALTRVTQVSGASKALGCDECWPEWLSILCWRVAETRQSWWSALVLSMCGCTYCLIVSVVYDSGVKSVVRGIVVWMMQLLWKV